MSIFRRKKKAETEPTEVEFQEISPEMLVKRFLWDIVPDEDIPSLVPLIGLVPDSPDVADMESRGSRERLAEVVPIVPLVDLFAQLVSGITSSAILVDSGENVEPDVAVALTQQHRQIIRASAVAIIANLIDLRVLSYPPDGVHISE